MGPDVSAIVRDEDGHIAEELDPMLLARSLQVVPLAKELVLEKGVKLHAGCELLPPTGQGHRLTPRDGTLPRRPRLAAMELFQRHEQGVIVEPRRLTLAERPQVIELRAVSGTLKGLEDLP